ncbi:hypothetical protein [uncultured Microscilla sp.]|uniref:hypothetical protein n=1 Tax=uncultured Microscilla sp. TaxID=432653 RepID=UPI0026161B44|nr:hypothetical protein [uncultured Microscilla sp.]
MKISQGIYGVIFSLWVSCSPPSPFSDDPRDKFIGRYSVSETCNPSKANQDYSMQIVRSASDTDSLIILENFYNSGAKIEGVVTGNRVAFPAQSFAAYTFSGNGTVFTKKESTERFIELIYIVQVTPGSFADTCQAKAIIQE